MLGWAVLSLACGVGSLDAVAVPEQVHILKIYTDHGKSCHFLEPLSLDTLLFCFVIVSDL